MFQLKSLELGVINEKHDNIDNYSKLLENESFGNLEIIILKFYNNDIKDLN